MLENTHESPLDCKEIKSVNPKGNQSWLLIGKTDAKAEAPVLWPCDTKSQVTGNDSDAGKDWRQKANAMAEDAIVRQHRQPNEHESEQTLGGSEGQGSLECGMQSMGSQRVGHNLVTEQHPPRKLLCAPRRPSQAPHPSVPHLCNTTSFRPSQSLSCASPINRTADHEPDAAVWLSVVYLS